MSNVSVEISGDGGTGGVQICGGELARFPRAGIRVYGQPGSDPQPSVIAEDFEDDTYAFGISGTWTRDNSRAHSGSWSFRSATITHSQTSDAVVTVPAWATSMSFWWFGDSEDAPGGGAFDPLVVLLDGVEQSFEGGGHSTDWAQETFDVTGVSTATIRYRKDSSVSEGADAVWIDDLTFRSLPSNGSVVHNGRTYGPVKAEMGELSDGDYGIAVVNDSGLLTKLTDFVFGPKAAYDQGEGNRDFDVHGSGYGDLAGAAVGPSVDVMIGETGRCLMIVGAEITFGDLNNAFNNNEGGGRMSVALSGANVRSASDAWSFYYSETWDIAPDTTTMTRHGAVNGSRMHFLTGLNPGLTTFTAQYRAVYGANSAPAIFKDRSLIVFPY